MQRLLLRHSDIKSDLRFLRLKLHGVLVADDNDLAISDYYQLHQTISAQGTMGQAWWVCVWRCLPHPILTTEEV